MSDLKIESTGYGTQFILGGLVFYFCNGLIFSAFETMKLRNQMEEQQKEVEMRQDRDLTPKKTFSITSYFEGHLITVTRNFIVFGSKIVMNKQVDKRYKVPEALKGCSGIIVGKILSHFFDTLRVHKTLDFETFSEEEKSQEHLFWKRLRRGIVMAVLHGILVHITQKHITEYLELKILSKANYGTEWGKGICQSIAESIALTIFCPLDIMKNFQQVDFTKEELDVVSVVKKIINENDTISSKLWKISKLWRGWYWNIPVAFTSILLTHYIFRVIVWVTGEKK